MKTNTTSHWKTQTLPFQLNTSNSRLTHNRRLSSILDAASKSWHEFWKHNISLNKKDIRYYYWTDHVKINRRFCFFVIVLSLTKFAGVISDYLCAYSGVLSKFVLCYTVEIFKPTRQKLILISKIKIAYPIENLIRSVPTFETERSRKASVNI